MWYTAPQEGGTHVAKPSDHTEPEKPRVGHVQEVCRFIWMQPCRSTQVFIAAAAGVWFGASPCSHDENCHTPAYLKPGERGAGLAFFRTHPCHSVILFHRRHIQNSFAQKKTTSNRKKHHGHMHGQLKHPVAQRYQSAPLLVFSKSPQRQHPETDSPIFGKRFPMGVYKSAPPNPSATWLQGPPLQHVRRLRIQPLSFPTRGNKNAPSTPNKPPRSSGLRVFCAV